MSEQSKTAKKRSRTEPVFIVVFATLILTGFGLYRVNANWSEKDSIIDAVLDSPPLPWHERALDHLASGTTRTKLIANQFGYLETVSPIFIVRVESANNNASMYCYRNDFEEDITLVCKVHTAQANPGVYQMDYKCLFFGPNKQGNVSIFFSADSKQAMAISYSINNSIHKKVLVNFKGDSEKQVIKPEYKELYASLRLSEFIIDPVTKAPIEIHNINELLEVLSKSGLQIK